MIRVDPTPPPAHLCAEHLPPTRIPTRRGSERSEGMSRDGFPDRGSRPRTASAGAARLRAAQSRAPDSHILPADAGSHTFALRASAPPVRRDRTFWLSPERLPPASAGAALVESLGYLTSPRVVRFGAALSARDPDPRYRFASRVAPSAVAIAAPAGRLTSARTSSMLSRTCLPGSRPKSLMTRSMFVRSRSSSHLPRFPRAIRRRAPWS